MKNVLFTLIFAWVCNSAYAQTIDLQGSVTDTSGTALEMVSVALLAPKDSSLLYFGITNEDGQYVIKEIVPGEYIHQVSFIGYSVYQELLKIDGTQSIVRAPSVSISPQLNLLSEVVVNGQRIPVIINKDTVEYNASSFEVRNDETVEDLLRKLPGIEVDGEGNIKAQGETVKKVLVDGKEFFGGDPKMATQNLPANAIKNVKVYDAQSEDSKYTGVDDGTREKTMDLALKEEFKKGYFGNIEGGLGTGESENLYYKAKGGIHLFNPTTRLSILGGANNLNEYGFDWEDMRNISGVSEGQGMGISISSDNVMPLNFMGPGTGVFSSAIGGMNFNYDPNKSHRLTLSYFLTQTNRYGLTETNSETFRDSVSLYGRDYSQSNSDDLQHSMSLSYRWDLDSNNRVETDIQGRFGTKNDIGRSTVLRQYAADSVVQSSLQNQNSDFGSNNWKGNVNYTRRFKKKGRNFRFRLSGEYTDNKENYDYRANNAYPIAFTRDSLSQNRTTTTSYNNVLSRLEYTEPLGEKHFLTLVASTFQSTDILDRITTDRYSDANVDTLSPNIHMNRDNISGSIEYKYSGKNNWTARFTGIQYGQSAADYRIGDQVDRRTWSYILPYLSWNNRSQGWSGSSVSLYQNVTLPQMLQWLSIPDVSNPLYIRNGNSELIPSLSTSLSFYSSKYDMFNETWYYINASVSTIENGIAWEQTIDDQFRTVSRPINMDRRTWSANLGGSYSRPIKMLKIEVDGGPDFNYSQSQAPVNGQVNFQENLSTGFDVGVSNLKTDKFWIRMGARFNWTWNFYSLNTSLNQLYSNQSYSLDAKYTVSKRLKFRTGIDYMVYSATSFAAAQNIPLWGAGASYALDKEANLWLELSAFDILGQNQGVSRTADINSIREVNNNTMRRYVLLSIKYNFKGN